MRRRLRGQSLVEMALILPLLLMVLFGIIDIGYYIYGYATIYFAARNGTEVAAELPPYPNKLNNATDKCTGKVVPSLRRPVTSRPMPMIVLTCVA